MIENTIERLNQNKFFIGMMTIFVTIGGRFIITELSENQKKLIHHPIIKKIFIFCAFYMATRDIKCAIVLTIMFILIITELFNDDVFFLNNQKHKNEKYETITNDKKIDQIIEELNQMKQVI